MNEEKFDYFDVKRTLKFLNTLDVEKGGICFGKMAGFGEEHQEEITAIRDLLILWDLNENSTGISKTKLGLEIGTKGLDASLERLSEGGLLRESGRSYLITDDGKEVLKNKKDDLNKITNKRIEKAKNLAQLIGASMIGFELEED